MSRFVEFINTADEDLAREVIAPNAEFHAPDGKIIKERVSPISSG